MLNTRVKGLIKNFYPVDRYLRNRFDNVFANESNANLFRGVFSKFQQALDSAPPTKPLGYDNEEAASLYRERTNNVYPTDYPVLFWLSNILTSDCYLFEIGGHIGVSYYSYQRYLDFSKLSGWTIQDVPAVVANGEKIAAQNENRQLAFTSSYKMDHAADILLANGSLQYIEESLAEIIRDKLKTLPDHILLNMLPVTEKSDYYTLQSIGAAFCPYKISSRASLVKGLKELGYELVDEWINPEKRCHIPFVDKSYSLDYYTGFYFRRLKS